MGQGPQCEHAIQSERLWVLPAMAKRCTWRALSSSWGVSVAGLTFIVTFVLDPEPPGMCKPNKSSKK